MEEVVQFDSGGLGDQLQGKGHGTKRGQRGGADEVSLGLVDILRSSLFCEVGEAAQERRKAVQGVGHPPIFGSRLMR